MRLALREAWHYQLLTYPNPAVGSLITGPNGELLAVAAHKEAGRAHAEVLAIRDAYIRMTNDDGLSDCDDAHTLHTELAKRSGDLFHDKTIYVTLEPCNHAGRTPACAGLIERLGFRRVVIGTMDPNPDATGGAERLRKRGVDVTAGVERSSCEALIEPFVKWHRTGRFVFFKLAQSLNGTIDGGTISCEASRRWVHTMRTKIDTLVIGGNTVRIDRPTLDSRLVGGRAPDVAILTRNGEKFDRSIPLFHVPDRKVLFVERLPSEGFNMVEGGAGTLETVKDEIDWMVLFVAPFVKGGMGYNASKNFELLHQRKSGVDSMLFLRALPDG